MFFYVIRHGQPDYANDCLTPAGRDQAELVARRLGLVPFDEIWSSPMGRAVETAQPTADKRGLPVLRADWAHEFDIESDTYWPDGVLKVSAKLPPALFIAGDKRRHDTEEALSVLPGLCDCRVADRYHLIAGGLDGFLSQHGYSRTADGLYKPLHPNEKHIALFSHNGTTRVILSHLMGIPFQCLVSAGMPYYTNITLFHFPEDAQEDLSPRLISYGDVGHLYADGKLLTHHAFPGEF